MIKRLLGIREPVMDYEIKEPLTVIVLLDKPYGHKENKRDRALMQYVELSGARVIFLNPDPNQKQNIIYPIDGRNIMVVKPGVDSRPMFHGRIVMFTAHPSALPTLRLAHPNLVVYDERGIYPPEESRDLRAFADIQTYVETSIYGAENLLISIESSQNRKPPRA